MVELVYTYLKHLGLRNGSTSSEEDCLCVGAELILIVVGKIRISRPKI